MVRDTAVTKAESAPKTEKKKKVFVDAETMAFWNERYMQNIHVKGLDHSRPEDHLKRELLEHFSGCGTIEDILFVPSIPERGFRGYASITFSDGEEAKKAILDLNKSFMGGVRLTVMEPFSKKEMKKIRFRLATKDIDVFGISEEDSSDDDSVEYVVIKNLSKKGKRERRQAVLEKGKRKKLKKSEEKKQKKKKLQVSACDDSNSEEGFCTF